MEKEEAEQYASFLEEIWRSNAAFSAKVFWANKVALLLIDSGYKMTVKTVNFAAEAV